MRSYVSMGSLLRNAAELLGDPKDWPAVKGERFNAIVQLTGDALGFYAAEQDKVEWLIASAWERDEA